LNDYLTYGLSWWKRAGKFHSIKN